MHLANQVNHRRCPRVPMAMSLVGVAALCAWGCGPSEGPELGEVSGTVTLDGKIVQDALLEFIPSNGEESIGYGATDEKGHYTVKYTYTRDGAVVGLNKVRITNGDNTVWGEEFVGLRPIFPARYNRDTELEVAVESGENVFDFDLETSGGSERPPSRAAPPSL